MYKIIWTEDLDSQNYKDSIKIRHEVFVEEQNVPVELEIDELEDQTSHIVIYQDGQAISTARIYDLGDGMYKVQRVAVIKEYRRQGVATVLMKEIEKKVYSLSGKELTLGAQNTAIPFYEKLDYEIDGAEFMDAGIPHHTMKKIL